MKNQGSTTETVLLLLGIIIAIGMAILAGVRTVTSHEVRLARRR